jgi:tetratricopeptide (TPR) repeat protein
MIATAAILVLLLAAQPAARADADDREARAHFHRAERAYGSGRVEEALQGYQAAYDARHLPGLLFNIAQCHRRLQQPDRAVFFYERYLEVAAADTPNRAVARRLLDEQRALVRARPVPGVPPSEVEPPPLPPQPQVALDVGPPRTSLLSAPPAAPPPAPARRRWWIWAGSAVLVVAAGTTAALLLAKRDGPLPEGPLGSIDRR